MNIKKFLLAACLMAVTALSYAQPPRVPQTYTFAGQTISFDRPDLYERMDRELLAFSYMHSTSTLMLKRSAKYFPTVEKILKEQGLPDDLKYIMVIESNLEPSALSRAGAAGLWQLMAVTAREMGLEVNANVDERYNTEKATRAACKFLKDAYAKYGDWLTVAASYNGGQGGISTKLKTQRQKRAVDLWLVEETARYPFRVMAAKMLFEHPEQFGFIVNPEDRYEPVRVRDIVETTNPIEDLVQFAEDHGTSYAQLKRANLWLREAKLNNSSHRLYKIVIPEK